MKSSESSQSPQSPQSRQPSSVVDRILWIAVTWFGVGAAPKAPGTFGSLAALPLIWALSHAGELTYMGFLILFIVFGIVVCSFYEFRNLGNGHDDSSIVIDEVIGMVLTFLWIPFHWLPVIVGFCLFRFLDILKPWPISVLDRKVKGGLGVVLDDIAAGMVVNLFLHFLISKGFFYGL